jgi:hypothetical protein
MGGHKMPGIKYLTTKQNQVIEDLFTGKLEVEDVLKKWGVSQRTYSRWHQQELFAAEYDRRLKLSHRQSELVFANWASTAASRLANLTSAEKEETARKACVDVINHPDRKAKIQSDSQKPPEEEILPEVPPEYAGTLLAALAEIKRCKSK